MNELPVLAALLDSREAYNALSRNLSLGDFSEFGQVVVGELAAYYQRDPAAAFVDRSLVGAALGRHFPSPKQSRALVDYFADIPESSSPENAVALYSQLRQRTIGLELADALVKGTSVEMVRPIMDRWAAAGTSGQRVQELDTPRLSADTIYSASAQGKLRVYPSRLNDVLRGGIKPGHNVLVFGRPNAGKSAVAINCAAGMAYHGHKVLYLANEESAESVQKRFLSRLGSATLWDLNHEDIRVEEANYRAAEEKALRRGYQHLTVRGGVHSLRDAEQLVQQIKPRVVVVDQIRHMETRLDLLQRQELVTRTLRDWAHKYAMVTIGTAQAGASGEGRGTLTVMDLDYSNTGVQGACDLMIGVAVTEEMKRSHKRMLCVVRNKLSGTEANFPVWLDEQHTMVKSKP